MAFINYVTQIQFEFGAVRLLQQECERVGITRPLIVTDSGLRDSPMIRNALKLVSTARLFADVRGNPVAANIDAGLEACAHEIVARKCLPPVRYSCHPASRSRRLGRIIISTARTSSSNICSRIHTSAPQCWSTIDIAFSPLTVV